MSGAHDRAPPERDQSDADGEDPSERYSNVKTPGSLDEDEEEQVDSEVQEMDASEALAGCSNSAEPAPQPDERIEEASTRANAMDHEPGSYADGNDHAQNMAPATVDAAASSSPTSSDDDTEESDGVANPEDLDWGEFIHRFNFWQGRSYASRTQLIGAFDCSPQVGGVSAETMLNRAVAGGYIIEQETTGGGYRYHPGSEVDEYV
jgi:hypothetical protein